MMTQQSQVPLPLYESSIVNLDVMEAIEKAERELGESS